MAKSPFSESAELTQNNPAFGGVGPISYKYNVPKDASLFVTQGDPDTNVFIRKGNQFFELDETQFGGATSGEQRASALNWVKQSLGISSIAGGNLGELGARGITSAGRLGKESFLEKVTFSEPGQTPEQTVPLVPEPGSFSPNFQPGEPIAPEQSLAGIQSVFGADWQPSPAFTPQIQGRGVYGAVRVGDNPNVFALGPGGSTDNPLTAQEFSDMFGTSEQAGIVGNISQQQANQLGISEGAVNTPVGPGISSETLADSDTINLDSVADTNKYDADIALAGSKEYLNSYDKASEALKTKKEKDKEAEVGGLEEQLKDLYGEGAVSPEELQLQEEEKRNIEEQQQAVDDANTALKIKVAEIDALTASYNLENQIVEGKAITLGRQRGQQGQNYKMYLAQKNSLTAEAGMLQAAALGLQGKLDSAQRAADRAVNLKWMAYEREISNRMNLYNIVKGQLSEIQQERGAALERYWQAEQAKIAEAKANEKSNYNTVLSQMNQYPDAGILLTDSLEVANQKITQNSSLYRKSVRISGPNGNDDTDDSISPWDAARDIIKNNPNLSPAALKSKILEDVDGLTVTEINSLIDVAEETIPQVRPGDAGFIGPLREGVTRGAGTSSGSSSDLDSAYDNIGG